LSYQNGISTKIPFVLRYATNPNQFYPLLSFALLSQYSDDGLNRPTLLSTNWIIPD